MKKIISLFVRDYETTRQVIDEVVEGAEWVGAGEGVATRKYDGTCCMVESGTLFKRYEVKKDKTPPDKFISANDIDPNTGKQQGWVPVDDGPSDKWHREGFKNSDGTNIPDGTYELLGPKIQKNPDKFAEHCLIAHSQAQVLHDAPRNFKGLQIYLEAHDIEGIVWHHPDGRMVKIKGKDFGFKRKPR